MALIDPRRRATVRLIKDGYVLALDDADYAVHYFIFHNAVQATGRYSFGDLRVGSQVRLLPIDHPKGPRGIEVEILEV